MVIEGTNAKILLHLQEVGNTDYDRGDCRFELAVESAGFSGRAQVWVRADKVLDFARQLVELDLRRQGTATLEPMSPGEYLHVTSVTSRGHMALKGRIAAPVYVGEAGPYEHSLEFGFEFDPSLLPTMSAQFERWSR